MAGFYRPGTPQPAGAIERYDGGVGGSGRAGEEGFLLEVEHLAVAISDAVDHLADLDAEDDLEAFGRMLDQLVERVQALLSPYLPAPTAASWRPALEATLAHLREAHDLLDDGESSDAVAVEVMAAGEGLGRRPAG
jgi:hypothetical protein